MGRPLKNKSNYIDENSVPILEAAATSVLRGDTFRGDLFSEGWLRVIRYGGDSRYAFLHCKREMINYACRQRELQKRQESFYQLGDSGICDANLFWIDITDGLSVLDKFILVERYKGKNTHSAIGRMVGLSRQAVCYRLSKIFEKLRK